MTSLPMALASSPVGIIIKNRETPARSTAIWAYLWAEDRRDEAEPWHRVTPVSHKSDR